MSTLIRNATIVNEGEIFDGSVIIEGERISKVLRGKEEEQHGADEVIDGKGKHLFPGVIDDQVHFREPGLTHKADIYTESKAAVAGGITSYMEMPNTVPQTLTQELLQEKYDRAEEVSLANYSFYMGASNDNLEEVLKTDPKTVCGVKVFMGASTGNMLVDQRTTLEGIFSDCPLLITTHCEDEGIIQANISEFKREYGDEVSMENHPKIRSAEACYRSSSLAVELAAKHDTRLHILHISTEKEIELFESGPVKDKKITSEACVHHLWFSDADYASKGSYIKWNPAVKSVQDREALIKAVIEDRIDVIATDHAPHTKEEKAKTYFECPSGGPLVQHSLVALLELYHQDKLSLSQVIDKMCHAPARCFKVEDRGFIREGYFADLVLVDMNAPWTVEPEKILYKCGWSPFEGQKFTSMVTETFVNGKLVFDNGRFLEDTKGQRLRFQG